MEGHKFPSELREAQSGGSRFGKGRRSPSALGGLWAMLQKIFQKSTLKSRVFCTFCKLHEMVSSAASARQFRLGSNHTIPVICYLGLNGSRQIR